MIDFHPLGDSALFGVQVVGDGARAFGAYSPHGTGEAVTRIMDAWYRVPPLKAGWVIVPLFDEDAIRLEVVE